MCIRNLIVTMSIVALLTVPLQAIGPYPASNLVGYWTFDNAGNLGQNTGPGGGGDLAGATGGTGTPTAIAGHLGTGAVDFSHLTNGGAWLEYNNGVGVPTNIPTGNSSFSISAWVNLRTSATGPIGKPGFVTWGNVAAGQQNTLGTETADVNVNIGLQNWWNSNDLAHNIAAAPYNYTVNSGWHHFGAGYDAVTGGHAIYFDGVQLPPRMAGAPNFGANWFRLGSGPNNFGGGGNHLSMEGAMDDTSIWNIPLTPQDFTALYNGGAGVPATSLLIPEPISMVLLGLGSVMALRRRKV